jgi:hypothetical protein
MARKRPKIIHISYLFRTDHLGRICALATLLAADFDLFMRVETWYKEL